MRRTGGAIAVAMVLLAAMVLPAVAHEEPKGNPRDVHVDVIFEGATYSAQEWNRRAGNDRSLRDVHMVLTPEDADAGSVHAFRSAGDRDGFLASYEAPADAEPSFGVMHVAYCGQGSSAYYSKFWRHAHCDDSNSASPMFSVKEGTCLTLGGTTYDNQASSVIGGYYIGYTIMYDKSSCSSYNNPSYTIYGADVVYHLSDYGWNDRVSAVDAPY